MKTRITSLIMAMVMFAALAVNTGIANAEDKADMPEILKSLNNSEAVSMPAQDMDKIQGQATWWWESWGDRYGIDTRKALTIYTKHYYTNRTFKVESGGYIVKQDNTFVSNGINSNPMGGW